MTRALYRKYRPTKLSEIVGQDDIVKILTDLIEKQKIGHAYLFAGPRGTGKTSIARIFAHAINNFSYQLEDYHPDIIELDAASYTSVDHIREIREKAIIAPTFGQFKVYIIDEIHMLSTSAFNAFLKLLEEPPAHVVFVMATTNPEKIPITIRSRAQFFQFNLASEPTIFDHLKTIATKENIPIDDSALKIIAHRGGGSFRDSISLLDQASTIPKNPITDEDLNRAFGLPSAQIIKDLIKFYQNQQYSELHQNLKLLFSQNHRPEAVLSDLIDHITKNIQPELFPLLDALSHITPPFIEVKLLLALIQPSYQNYPQKTPQPKIPTPKVAPHPQSTPITSPDSPTPVSSPRTTNTDSSNPTLEKSALNPDQFDWQNFIEASSQISNLLKNLLQKSTFQISDTSLTIFPATKTGAKLLQSKKLELAKLISLEIIISDTPPKNQSSSTLSAIMGNIQEVTNDGAIPF